MFASEYGWSIEYIMDLPCDVTPQLMHAILWRKGIETTTAESRPPEGTLWDRLRSMVDTTQ